MKALKKISISTYLILNRFLSLFRLHINFYPSADEIREQLKEFFTLIRPESQLKEFIRIGSDNDGGYLVPNDLEGIKYCYSPGVSNNSDFEDQLSTYGIECFLADYSVDAPAKDNPLFLFTKKYLAIKTMIRLFDWKHGF